MKPNTLRILTCVMCAVALTGPIWTRASADAPPKRYTVLAGTVRDNVTQLTWQQTIDPTLYAWDDAKTYCKQLTLSGGGWRAPRLKELITLIDPTLASAPVIDASMFPSTPASAFWTANENARDATKAWLVNFAFGNTSSSELKTTAHNVRCVR